MSRNLRFLGQRHSDLSMLERMTTHRVQTPDEIQRLARQTGFPAASLQGAASFYDFMQGERAGKKAHVCTGTVCRMSGHEARVRAHLQQHYAADEIGEMACVGHCDHGGGFEAEGRTFDVRDLDGTGQAQGRDVGVSFRSTLADPVFGAEAEDANVDGDALYQAALAEAALIQAQLDASGLRGRGGAGFPFARKLQSCAAQPGRSKYVVCNADEGDPGAFSDRFLLEHRPARLLAGMLAAAQVLGARDAYIYLRAEYPQAARTLAAAIEQYDRSPAALSSGVRFHVLRGAGAYVCGEETALLNSIEGLRPEVRVRPPFPAEAGLYGQPTLLSNVETFAAIPWILSRGGAAFAAMGNGQSTGSKLLSIDRSFVRPGVLEVAMGTPLAEVVYGLGGGFVEPVKALQVGGPLGGVLPVAHIEFESESKLLRVDFESFREAGFLLGHGSIVGIPTRVPMPAFLAHLFAFMANESCGRCFPCRLGTRKGADLLAGAAQQAIDRSLFDDLLNTLAQGSLCALGGGLPLPARNILEHFADEMAGCFRQEVQA